MSPFNCVSLNINLLSQDVKILLIPGQRQHSYNATQNEKWQGGDRYCYAFVLEKWTAYVASLLLLAGQSVSPTSLQSCTPKESGSGGTLPRPWCLRGAKWDGHYNEIQYLVMRLCYAESSACEFSAKEAQSSCSPASVWGIGRWASLNTHCQDNLMWSPLCFGPTEAAPGEFVPNFGEIGCSRWMKGWTEGKMLENIQLI